MGGAEVDLVGKLTFLHRELGYPITVCCLMRRGELADSFEAVGAKILGPLMTHRQDVNALASLRRYLTRGSWDIVHSHMYEASLLTGLALATLFRGRRPRWIVSEHAMAEYWDAFPLLMLRLLARQAAAFVVPTERAAQSFAGCGVPERVLRVIPNGVALATHPPGERESVRARVRAALEIPETETLLGTVCRLHAVKALPVLFEAIAPLPVRLVVAGDGPARNELEALIAERGYRDRVRLLGTRSDVADLLAALDLFVLSSLSESMSIAVAEALVAGLPVVATRTGGVPEITGNGAFARLVPPGDVVALREAISGTLHELPAARQRAAQGGAWVREHLSVGVTARQLHALYVDERT